MCIEYKKDNLRLAWDKQAKAVIYTKQCSSINILHVDFKNLGKLNKNLRSIPSNLKKIRLRVFILKKYLLLKAFYRYKEYIYRFLKRNMDCV